MYQQSIVSTRPHIIAQDRVERRIAKAWRIVQIVNTTVAIYIVAVATYFFTLAVVA